MTVDLRDVSQRTSERQESWWTTRAHTAEVRGGFSRADYQKVERSREGPTQLLARVGDLLVELCGMEAIES